jgi:D-arabinose 1-dehydrogenase-like Zn-dependent alcohol dehydrogenase
MRALTLRGPRDAQIVDVAPPAPGAAEVLVQISACGVCASDLNAWRGVPGIEFPLAAGAPGHETIGRVAALGPGVSSLQVGQRVTGLMWNGFAELGVARAEHLVPLPDGAPDVLGEPLACAFNVIRRAALQPGNALAFVGFGYLAALIAQLLPDSVDSWIAFSRRPFSRALARSSGAAATYDFADVPDDIWDRYPVVIESAGVQQSLDYATWLVAYGGRLVIAGYHADGPRSVNMQTWNWKGIDVVNAHERRPEVYVEALRTVLPRMPLSVASLQTHCFPLERIAEAFQFAEERPPNFVKSIIEP